MIQIQYDNVDQMQRFDKIVQDTLVLFKQLHVLDATWTLKENKHGYQIHTKPDHTTGLCLTRGEGFMPYTPEEIFQLISAVDRRPEYDDMCESGTVIKQFDDVFGIFHQQFKGLFMVVSGRDFVVISKTFIEGDTWFCVGRSIDGIKEPIKGVVRAELKLAGWMLKKVQGGTQCVFVTWADPKGSLPPSMVNVVATNQGRVVEKVKKLLDKGKGK